MASERPGISAPQAGLTRDYRDAARSSNGISSLLQAVAPGQTGAQTIARSVPEDRHGEAAAPRGYASSTRSGDRIVPVPVVSGRDSPYLRPSSPARRSNAVAAEELAQSSPVHNSGTPTPTEHVYKATSQSAQAADHLHASQRRSQEGQPPQRRHRDGRLKSVSHVPPSLTHHNHEQPPHPTLWLARLATIRSPFNWLNWTWGILFTALVPAIGSIIWYGVIPVGPSQNGSVGDKALWVFLINPASFSFLSYLLLSLFFTALDETSPHRPFLSYAHIIGATYFANVLMPGLVVLLDEPFDMVALQCIGLTCLVTLAGIRLTPRTWFCDDDELFMRVWKVYLKLIITFLIWTGFLAGYMILNAQSDGAAQGFLTVGLTVIGFIVKKCMLQFADPINLETAMLVAGLWTENLSDVFVTLAFPTADDPGPTFAIIFLLRIGENLAYLWFQLNIWFTFRVWIKSKFKKDQGPRVEEDLPEYDDDRGHSAFHPGYRRRQLRFLVQKIFSQVSSYLYFLALVPVLRFGPNRRRFPYSDPPSDLNDGGDGFDREEDEVEERVTLQDDTILENGLQYLDSQEFWLAMVFACIQIAAALAAGLIIWLWMHRYHRNVIVSVRERYNIVVVKSYHYGLVLSIMLVNSLIATSFLQIYYRVYFV